MVQAAVLTQLNKPLEIKELELTDLRPDEVRIKMHATGICHTDLSVIQGKIPTLLSCVLGHEGAGEIIEVGGDVSDKKVGDHVILAFCSGCGQCRYCKKFKPALCQDPASRMRITAGTRLDGSTAHKIDGKKATAFMGLGTFGQETTVYHKQAIVIDKKFPLISTSLIGCGVSTGVGAVFNTAKVQPESIVAVIGCGGVGLNVIQGAKIAGAGKIIAIDINDEKLETAKRFGATHVINSKVKEPVGEVLALNNGLGADYAFEVLGSQVTFQTALMCTAPDGLTVLVGVPNVMDNYSFPFLSIIADKKITGCLYGSIDPDIDFARYLKLYHEKKLLLDELVTKEYRLEDINQALEDMQAGLLARGIIRYD